MPTNKLTLMIVAGEASGDLHAAKLVRALREASPDKKIDFFGAAGPRMRDESVEPVVLSDNLAVVGLPEIGRALPMFVRAFRALKKAAQKNTPDAAILVDFPDFNLKLARSLKKQGIPVIYYISPQLWAWRGHRVAAVKKYVDLMITILPFEREWYEACGVRDVVYVGSPLALEVHSDQPNIEFCRVHSLDPLKPIIALLPGSRGKEISRILPVMLSACRLLSQGNEGAQFIIAAADSASAELARDVVGPSSSGISTKIIIGQTYDALNASDVATVTSGTATLEAAIIGTPMIVVYKTSAANYRMLRPLISVEHFGLVNLIAGKRIAKELIQDDFTAQTLADELLRLLEPEANAAMRESLKAASDKLGHGGASKRAALAILDLLSET